MARTPSVPKSYLDANGNQRTKVEGDETLLGWRIRFHSPTLGEVARTYYGTYEDAVIWQNDLRRDADEGVSVSSPVTRTFGEVAEEWLAQYRWLNPAAPEDERRPRKFSTWQRNNAAAHRYLFPYRDRDKSGKLRGKTLEDWPIRSLDTDTAERIIHGFRLVDGTAPSDSTRLAVAATFRLVMKHAERYGYITRTPFVGIRADYSEVKEVEYIPTPADVLTVAELLDRRDPILGNIVRLHMWTGCRTGELLALKWDDVHLGGRYISIKESAGVSGGRYERGTTKTRTSVRDVPMLDGAFEALTELGWAERRYKSQFVASWKGYYTRRKREDGTWEGVKERRAIGYATYRQVLADAVAQAMGLNLIVRGFTAKDLRNTFATLLIESGRTADEARAALGHSSTHMTLQKYAGRFERSRDVQVKAIEFDLSKLPPETLYPNTAKVRAALGEMEGEAEADPSLYVGFADDSTAKAKVTPIRKSNRKRAEEGQKVRDVPLTKRGK